jgi:tungstate transport system substrate-binding protein
MLELKLWKQAGLSVPEKSSGTLKQVRVCCRLLQLQRKKSGYTLTDRATYIKYEHNMKNNPSLVILSEKDKAYFNQYSAIEVNPDRCPNVNNKKAREFIKWMASPKIQKFIGDYKINGKKLFVPNAK